MKLDRNELIVTDAWIGGQKHHSESSHALDVLNPATDLPIVRVQDCGPTEAMEAVAAAEAALPAWRALPACERATLLKKWCATVLDNMEDLARLMSLEQGKPLAESRGEVKYGAGFIEWFAEETVRIYGETIPENARGRKIMVVKEPVGVIAAITPWNFPIAMLTRKLAPALAAGCTAVCKPSEDAPLCALAIGKLATEAGIPSGVINMIPASRDNGINLIGKWLDDPRVRKISFTGSTAVGKYLAEKSAKTLKRISLELGGNSAFIIFDDADLDMALRGLLASKFRNTGQTCVCANRILVHDSVYDAFTRNLVDAVSQMEMAAASNESTAQLGPLINEKAIDKVEQHITDAVAKGARILVGGERDPRGNNFYKATVLADAMPGMRLASEETFGPVASLFRFHTEEEAIALANSTPSGLAACLHSQNIQRVWHVAAALEVGMVGINEGIISTEVAPFGGIKESGYGREGSLYGIEEYLNVKYLCMGGLSA